MRACDREEEREKNFTCNLNPFIKLLYKNSHWADFLSAVQGVGVWGGGASAASS